MVSEKEYLEGSFSKGDIVRVAVLLVILESGHKRGVGYLVFQFASDFLAFCGHLSPMLFFSHVLFSLILKKKKKTLLTIHPISLYLLINCILMNLKLFSTEINHI